MRAHTDRMGMAGVGTAWGRSKCLSSAAPVARSAGVAHRRSRLMAMTCGRTTESWTVRGRVGFRNPLAESALSESMKPNANASVRARTYGQSEVLLSVVAGYYVVTVMLVLARSSRVLEMSLVGASVG